MPDRIEIRRNADGTLDEVVVGSCSLHLEQLSDGHWWLCAENESGRVDVNLTSRGVILGRVVGDG